MRYISKPQIIEAIQYGPEFHSTLVQDVAEFIAGRSLLDHELMDYVRPHGIWNPPHQNYSTIEIQAGVDGAQGWVSVPLGSWVVRQPDVLNDHWPVEPNYFKNKYEEYDGG